jgi:hypothetical protein
MVELSYVKKELERVKREKIDMEERVKEIEK